MPSKSNKIAVITPAKFPGTAGDTANYSEIVDQLVREGFEVTLICPSLPAKSRSPNSDTSYDLVRVPALPPRLDQVASTGLSTRHYAQLGSFLLAESLTVFSLLIRKGIRSAYLRHGLLTMQLPVLLKILRIKTTADGELFADSLRDIKKAGFLLNLLRRYENRVIRMYDYFKVSTKKQRDNLVKIGYPEERILVVPMSVNIDRIPQFEVNSIPKHTFGYFGTLETWQGTEVLVEAFRLVLKQIPEAKLYLIGDGSLRPKIERKVQEYQMSDAVILAGSMSRDLLWKNYFDKFQILVLPRPRLNNSIDTLPSIKLVEAMASGKAIIASDIPAMKDEPPESMMLVPPNDPVKLADAMIRLSNNEKLMQDYSRAALGCAQGHDIRKNINLLASALEA